MSSVKSCVERSSPCATRIFSSFRVNDLCKNNRIILKIPSVTTWPFSLYSGVA